MTEVVVAVMLVTLYRYFYVLTHFLHNLIVLKMEMIQLIKRSARSQCTFNILTVFILDWRSNFSFLVI